MFSVPVDLAGAIKASSRCWELVPPFNQPHSWLEGWAQHGAALWCTRCLFTFIHVSLTSPSGVQHLFLGFVLFVTTARGINLIQTLNVYGPELPRTTVFQTPWPFSRCLLYNPHDDRQRVPRTPKLPCETTQPGLSLAFALL